MPELWSLCDVVLVHLKDMPVFETVLPSKIFEAMGMGLPVLVAGPDGEAADLVRRTGCGTWVPAEDPERLAECVRDLHDRPAYRLQLAEASRLAAAQYDRNQLAARLLGVFDPRRAA